MRINGYRCDGCGKEHLLPVDRIINFYGKGLPPDWFIVIRGAGDDGLPMDNNPETFCSGACLCTEKKPPEAEKGKTQRRLTLILRCDLLIGGDRSGYIHARGRTVYELFSEKFPEAEELDETILDSNGTSIIDWRYTLDDAYDEHIEWARLAKEFGLIDHYVVDEVPA